MKGSTKILLVEDDVKMRGAFAFCIEKSSDFQLIGETGKQKEAMEVLKRGECDVVILDLELEEGDGIHLLEEMKLIGTTKPYVIVITNNRSSSILQYLRQSGADFICQKSNESYSPMKVLEIIRFTYRFHDRRENNEMEIISYRQSMEENYRKERIEGELLQMGFKAAGKGTICLIEAIYYRVFEAKDSSCTMREVYEVVADRTRSKPLNVEKVIRDNIERVWKKTKPEILERWYPYEVSCESGCPTNSEFVVNMAKKFCRL